MSKISPIPHKAPDFCAGDFQEARNLAPLVAKVTIAVNATLSVILAGIAIACVRGHLDTRKSLVVGGIGIVAAAIALCGTSYVFETNF